VINGGRINTSDLFNHINGYHINVSGDWSGLDQINDSVNENIIERYRNTNGLILDTNLISSIISFVKGIPGNYNRIQFASMFSSYQVPGNFHVITVRRYRLESLNMQDTGIIYLDGTTSPNVVRCMFPNRNIIPFIRNVPINSPVLQLSSGYYPMRTIEVGYFGQLLPNVILTRSGERLLDLTRLIVLKEHYEGRRILICSRKRYENLIQEKLHDLFNYDITYYGATVGSNEWEEFDSVLLFGTPFISETLANQMATLLNIGVQEVRDLFGINDQIQIMHRIRPVLKNYGEGCRYYALTKQDLGLPNVRKMSILQMSRYLTGQVAEGASPENAMRIKEDIIDYLEEHGPTTKNILIRSIRGNNNFVRQMINNMIDQQMLEVIKIREREKRGRPREFIAVRE